MDMRSWTDDCPGDMAQGGATQGAGQPRLPIARHKLISDRWMAIRSKCQMGDSVRRPPDPAYYIIRGATPGSITRPCDYGRKAWGKRREIICLMAPDRWPRNGIKDLTTDCGTTPQLMANYG